MKQTLLLLSLLFISWSCEKETLLNIPITEIKAFSEGGTQLIPISTNKDWRAKSSEDWCILVSLEGDAKTDNISAELLRNDTNNDRTCIITIYVAGRTHTVKIYQSQLSNLKYYTKDILNLNSIQEDTITRMIIIGELSNDDLFRLKTEIPKLIYLDLTNAVCHDNQFPERAFGENEVENANKMIQTIFLPKTINKIGKFAFKGCAGLTNITIPSSITNIGWYAFYGCTGLTDITIANSITSIGWYAFSGCIGLTNITIPSSVSSISYSAFMGCAGLTNINIQEGVTSIDDYAFHKCVSLTNITIPSSISSIGSGAFSECSSVEKVRFTHLIPLPYEYKMLPTNAIIEVPLSVVEIYKSISGWSSHTIIGY